MPVKRHLVEETRSWCEAFGGACRSLHKAEMQRRATEVKAFAARLARPASATDEIKDLIAALEEIREREVDIDAAIAPIEVGDILNISHCA